MRFRQLITKQLGWFWVTIFWGCHLAPSPNLLPDSVIVRNYRSVADKIISAAIADSSTYDRLAELCDSFGPRFSGSQNLEDAIDWILDEMKKDGLENVHGEEVMVPRWIRGDESAEMLSPRRKDIPILGLGGSIETPPEGITADVLVVKSFDELNARGQEAKGKIVVFNVPFTTYGETVTIRYAGAPAAARAGAVASLIRSVGPFSMQTPHTGGMAYEEGLNKIPHAAITIEDAMMLQRMQDRGEKISLRIKAGGHFEPDSPSRNVVAEIRGWEKPEEVVILGGHIDSWDVGQGAMDDAGGCVAAWEAVKLIQNLGLKPRRTIRVVLWTNEENGLRGGSGYRDAHLDELENIVAAIESDHGTFKPTGFNFGGSAEAMEIINQISRLLIPIESNHIIPGNGAADIGPLREAGVPVLGLEVEASKYFWYHHTDADTIDKLDPHEINLCQAAMAIMAYVLADMPDRLPR